MNERAVIGDNLPPDPIDEICAAYEGPREEAENWLDGSKVETEAQMNAVDALRKAAREWRLELERGEKSATAPLYDAYKAEGARWKPVITDAKRIEAGLVGLGDAFKRKLAEEKAAAKREADRKAWAAADEARKAAEAADVSDLAAQREAAEKQAAFELAQAEARRAADDTVKGMRKVTRYEITDHRSALHDIAVSDRNAITAFIEEYVRKHHKARAIKGVRVWEEKESF